MVGQGKIDTAIFIMINWTGMYWFQSTHCLLYTTTLIHPAWVQTNSTLILWMIDLHIQQLMIIKWRENGPGSTFSIKMENDKYTDALKYLESTREIWCIIIYTIIIWNDAPKFVIFFFFLRYSLLPRQIIQLDQLDWV